MGDLSSNGYCHHGVSGLDYCPRCECEAAGTGDDVARGLAEVLIEVDRHGVAAGQGITGYGDDVVRGTFHVPELREGVLVAGSVMAAGDYLTGLIRYAPRSTQGYCKGCVVQQRTNRGAGVCANCPSLRKHKPKRIARKAKRRPAL